jgi:uncharacterized protein (TIGR00369 family)
MPDLPKGRRYGVVDQESHLQLSGLDLLHGILAGRIPSPFISQTLDFHLASVELGKVTFETVPDRRTYNPAGTVHGGFIATLLDSCMTCAALSTLGPGRTCTTLEFKIHFVRPLLDGVGQIRAEGRLIHGGRRQATAEGDVKDLHGRLYAHGTTTCLVHDL